MRRNQPPRSGASPSSTAPGAKPNIVLLIADDMRADHLEYMPAVRRLVQDQGVTYTQARCNVPLCQPSRVGLMTGQMSKHNNELGIGFTGTQLRDHDNCLGKWISDAGYRCGYFGKYVNFTDGRGGIDSPAGYATWREQIHTDPGYEFMVHLEQGTETDHRHLQHRLLGRAGVRVHRGQRAVHVHRRLDAAARAAQSPQGPPHEVLGPRLADRRRGRRERQARLDSGSCTAHRRRQGADPRRRAAVRCASWPRSTTWRGKIIEAMSESMLANTVIVFTSDNGVHHGEHRRRGAATKAGPYEVGLRVPLLVRGPGFEAGSDVTVPSLVFQDLNATMLGLAGATGRTSTPSRHLARRPVLEPRRAPSAGVAARDR